MKELLQIYAFWTSSPPLLVLFPPSPSASPSKFTNYVPQHCTWMCYSTCAWGLKYATTPLRSAGLLLHSLLLINYCLSGNLQSPLSLTAVVLHTVSLHLRHVDPRPAAHWVFLLIQVELISVDGTVQHPPLVITGRISIAQRVVRVAIVHRLSYYFRCVTMGQWVHTNLNFEAS